MLLSSAHRRLHDRGGGWGTGRKPVPFPLSAGAVAERVPRVPIPLTIFYRVNETRKGVATPQQLKISLYEVQAGICPNRGPDGHVSPNLACPRRLRVDSSR